MKARLALVAVVFLSWVAPAHAHRLDEYLQATTIALEKDRLLLQLRLTPGVAVAGQVLASLDVTRDGTISDAGQRAYAERVGHDLSLALDGRPLPLRLASFSFPGAEEMTGGLGDILLTFEADLPPGGAATRRLMFANHHQSAVAVYLVNCLLPHNPGIRVVAQDRSEDQARYQLDFSSENAAVFPPAAQALADAPHLPAPPVAKTSSWQGVRHFFAGGGSLVVGALMLAVVTLLRACSKWLPPARWRTRSPGR